MDHERFDDLIRTVVSRRSRRRFTGTAVTLLGGLLANPLFDGASDMLAKNKKKKKKRRKKKPPCGGGCPPCQECVNGNCEWIPFPDCYGCQEPLCEGGVFNCKETGVGTSCGEYCLYAYECCTNQAPGCPAGRECCPTSPHPQCIDASQCCGGSLDPPYYSYVGVACGTDCCNPAYDHKCCFSRYSSSGKVCWQKIAPCADCQVPCDVAGTVCCDLTQECKYRESPAGFYCA